MKFKVKIMRWGHIKCLNDDYGYNMWEDANKLQGVRLSSPPKCFRNETMLELHQWCCKEKKMKFFWYRVYLFGSKIKKSDNNIVILNDMHPCFHNLDFLDYLKKRYHVFIALCCVNQFQNKDKPKIKEYDLEIIKKKIDIIYTTDREDATNFHLKYVEGIYSKIISNLNVNINEDLFYVGADKERTKLLLEIDGYLKDKDIDTNFNVVRKGEHEGKINGINFVQWKPYVEILKQAVSSNCILEIVEKGQTSSTLRYLEAVCYNKKLLTNNENVKKFRFYDSNNISVFKDAKEIDIDFLKDEKKVEFHYADNYSPQKIVYRIMIHAKRKFNK